MACASTLTLDPAPTSQPRIQFEGLPLWMQEYLEGSANEVYEVAALPSHLVGLSYEQVG